MTTKIPPKFHHYIAKSSTINDSSKMRTKLGILPGKRDHIPVRVDSRSDNCKSVNPRHMTKIDNARITDAILNSDLQRKKFNHALVGNKKIREVNLSIGYQPSAEPKLSPLSHDFKKALKYSRNLETVLYDNKKLSNTSELNHAKKLETVAFKNCILEPKNNPILKNNTVKELYYHKDGIELDEMEVLTNIFKSNKFKKLDIGTRTDTFSLPILLKSIKKSSLESFSIKGFNLEPQVIKELAEALDGHPTLESLCFKDCNFNSSLFNLEKGVLEQALSELTSVLQNTSIKELVFQHSYPSQISKEILEMFANALPDNKKLYSLQLNCGKNSIDYIIEKLEYSNLKHLKLSFEECDIAIMKKLSPASLTLESLDLSFKISEEGAVQHLAQELKNNKHLKSLKLTGYYFCEKDIQSLRDLLKNNNKITTLELQSGRGISEKYMNEIEKLVLQNRQLAGNLCSMKV